MINEDILGKCFRFCWSGEDPRISPLTPPYRCPRQSLLIITRTPETNRMAYTPPTRRTTVKPHAGRRALQRVLFHYSMHNFTSIASTCFEHSNLLKVNVPTQSSTRLRAQAWQRSSHRAAPLTARRAGREIGWLGWPSSTRANGTGSTCTERTARTAAPDPRSNYELFNCSNFNIRYWSWNYRGCWHQTCPPIDPR